MMYFLVGLFVCVHGALLSNSLLDEVKKDLGPVPPTALTLIEHDHKRRDHDRLQSIEEIVTKVLRKNSAQEKKRSKKGKNEPASKKKSTHRDASLDLKINQEKKKLEQAIVSKEILQLLNQQYEDHEIKNKKISVTLKNVNVSEAIKLISRLSGVTLVVDTNVTGTIPFFSFKEIELAVLLKIIVNNNVPRLALIKDFGIWRIVTYETACALLHDEADELIAQDMVGASYAMHHTKWDEAFKRRVEKMWTCIVGAKAAELGMYLFFDDSSKKIFARARRSMVNDLHACLKEIDIRIPQVRIDARVVLASKDFEDSLGMEWSGIYDNHKTIKHFNFAGVGIGNTHEEPDGVFSDLLHWSLNFIPAGLRELSTIKIPLIFGGNDFSKRRLNLVLNAAETRGEMKTILKPTFLIKSDELAEILCGEEMPQEVRLQETVEGNPTNISTINYKDIGMKIRIKPVVSSDGESVFLDVYVENSELAPAKFSHRGSSQQGNDGVATRFNYTIETSRSQSRVILKSGQTTLIGGLMVKRKEKINTGIPYLQDIPILGWLFKGKREVVRDKQLLIFLSPTLV
jgi:type IV pilus assembly protein PilQ